MAYGTLKCDNITFTNGGIDQTVTVSGIVQSISGNITATGTIQAATIIGTSTVSGATVTGNAGVFTTVTGGSAGFTTVTGTTVTGTTANFATLSGTTITGSVGNFGSGSAAAPSVSVGTTDNGLYSPGADQVAISTSGTGHLFVDANGNVGLGISPTTRFHVYQAGSTQAGLIETNQSASVLNFKSTGQSSGQPQVGCAGSDMILNTNGSERLRITSDGKLGLGTSTPTESFHTTGAIRVTGAQTTAGTGIYLDQTAGVGNVSVYGPDNSTQGTFRIYTATANGGTGSAKLVVDSSGRVGIGTSSPQAALDISLGIYSAVRTNLSSITDTYQQFRGTPDGSGYEHARVFSGRDTSVHTYGSYLAFYTEGKSSGTTDTSVERLRIDSSGRVGIGSTSPSEKLTLSDGNIRLDSTTSTSKIILFYDTAGLRHIIGSDATAGTNEFGLRTEGQIVFGAGSGRGEAVRIDASKRLLVGTSSARNNFFNTTTFTPQLQLEGTGTAQILSVTSSDTVYGPYLLLARQKSGSVGGNTAVSNNDLLGSVDFQGSDGTEFIAGGQIKCEVDGTPGANDMPGRLVFSTTADGASSPTERMRIASTGLVATFSATGADTFYSNTTEGAGTAYNLFRGGHSATSPLSSTACIRIYTNGNVQNTNNSYGSLSDIKLKENIVDANSQWDDIKALQVRNYNLKEGQTHTQIGLVAQEVEPISPGLVYESPDRDAEGNDLGTVTKSVNYSVLYMKAVKALQEAMERIETLEAKVAALESA